MSNNELHLTVVIPVRQKLTLWKTQEEKPVPVRQGERIAARLREELEKDLSGVISKVVTRVIFEQPEKQLRLIIDQGRELIRGYNLEVVMASIMEEVYGQEVRFGGAKHSEDSLH